MFKKSLFSGLIFMISTFSYSYQNDSKKVLRLHFDVNKTIIATDAVQNKGLEETINSILAESTFHTWNGTKVESFNAYITDIFAQENPHISRADELFKSQQSELIKTFPQHLKQYPDLLTHYNKEKATMLKILKKEESETVIFPSFIKLIHWLHNQSTCRFTIYLRTFGKDIPTVTSYIENNSPLKFTAQGKIQDDKLYIESKNQPVVDFFKNKNSKHYAIQDDYAHWKSHHFQTSGGKPFLIDVNNHQEIAMFFDDNANNIDKPIIRPIDPHGNILDTNELLEKGNIIAVNPKEAILDEDYFINKIKNICAD